MLEEASNEGKMMKVQTADAWNEKRMKASWLCMKIKHIRKFLQTPRVKMVESELTLSEQRLQESVKFRFVDSNLNLRTGQSHVLNRQLKP